MLGDEIIALFGSFGIVGSLVALYLLFLVDATIFPALPELFAVIVFLTDISPGWGVMVLVIACLGEVSGNSLLYLFVRKVRVPRVIDRFFNKYVDFLICSDERLILLNRIAPAIPFTGAFIAICKWDYRRSMAYVLVGGLFKYSALFVLVWTFGNFWDEGTARVVTLAMVLVMIAVSAGASILYKKRMLDASGCGQPENASGEPEERGL